MGEEFNSLKISGSKSQSFLFENLLDGLTIKDDLVSEQSMDSLKKENKSLRNKIVEINEYSLVLHKMIALLRKQNSVVTRSECISQKVETMCLQDDMLCDLNKEEQILSVMIEHKQNQIHELRIPKREPDNQFREDQTRKVEAHINQLNMQIHELQRKIDHLTEVNTSLQENNDRLNSLFNTKSDEVQMMQNKVNICTNIIEEQSRMSNNCVPTDESHPWVVDPKEISISPKLLGTGAWGTVSLGTFRGLTVAVKQLHRLILSSHNKGKFLREMEISSRIRHPHILQFLCCSQQDQTLLVVTEVMDITLREAYLSNSISLSQRTKILLQCAIALQYLHDFKPQPIIHRDISSCNVLLSAKTKTSWVAKLSDFGAANFLRDELSCTPGAAIYAAPEAFSTVQSTKIDVYSIGVLTIELLTNRLPEPASRQRQLESLGHEELKVVVGSMLERKPENRPDMANVVGAFRAIFDLPPGIQSDCS